MDKQIHSDIERDNEILNKVYVFNKRAGYILNGKYIKQLCEDDINYVNNRFDDSESFNESLQRMFMKIYEKPKCPICGKPVKWHGKKKRPLLKTCSEQCGFKYRQQQNEKLWMTREGVTNVFASNACKEKIKETCLKKYGCENPMQNAEIKEKLVNTCLEKYGLTNGGGSKESLEKMQHHFLEKYGVKYPAQVEEVKEKFVNTCLKKYGVKYPWQTEEIKEKIKETCLKRYGYKSYIGSPMYYKNLTIYLDKIRDSKKKNLTYTTSKSESYIYNLLTKKFNVIHCQYKCELYPYSCDFYIPEIDTFIEYQGFWTHGEHAYDNTNKDDVLEANKLLEKNLKHKIPNHNLYWVKYYVWTIKDVEKRNTAKKNNLNFLEFYSIIELEKWLNNYGKENN